MILKNYSLKKHNTFGIDINCKYYVSLNSISELENISEFIEKNKIPFLVIGEGSNILFLKNFEGLIIYNNIKINEINYQNKDIISLKLGAGLNWIDVVNMCVKNNWSGIENLALIPGKVGAAPIQNIGAYGVEIKDVIESVLFYNIFDKKTYTLENKQCEFKYRESIFKGDLKNKGIILSVNLILKKNFTPNIDYLELKEYFGNSKKEIKILDVKNKIEEIRKNKLPDYKIYGNSGSFFKNPIIKKELFDELKNKFQDIKFYKINDKEVKIPAAWLIEKSGWKGKKIGNVGVYKNQPLVLINFGNAKGTEIYELSEQIIESIFKMFKIKLEREVNII